MISYVAEQQIERKKDFTHGRPGIEDTSVRPQSKIFVSKALQMMTGLLIDYHFVF